MSESPPGKSGGGGGGGRVGGWGDSGRIRVNAEASDQYKRSSIPH